MPTQPTSTPLSWVRAFDFARSTVAAKLDSTTSALTFSCAEVAKRVGTPATAPFHTLAVDDLSQVDLSCTPPLGSLRDAVQMAVQSWVGEHQLPGAPRLDRIRANALVQSFLTGAGTAVGAIAAR